MTKSFKQTAPKVIVFCLAVLSLSGCGKLDFTQELLHPLNPISVATAQGVEVVSGASTGKKTLVNGYTVDASVGAVRDKLESTTPNGYKVYNGVNGAIVSDAH